MVHDATYSSKYNISCNKISIDLLKSLDKFLLEKEIIPQNILNSHVFFGYENCTIYMQFPYQNYLIKNNLF